MSSDDPNLYKSRYKAVIIPRNDLWTISDDECDCYQLSQRQVALLMAVIEPQLWRTRWLGVSNSDAVWDETKQYVEELIGVLTVPCSCGGVSSCCPGDSVYVDVQIQNVIDNLPPDYDPNDPGTINPEYDSSDPLVQQALTAALCEGCKVWIAMYSDAMYQAQLTVCSDAQGVPPWKQIAEQAAEAILSFGASVMSDGIALSSKLLAIAGIEGGGLQIAPAYLRNLATQFEQPPCPPKRLIDEVQLLYACCMYERLKDSFMWEAFRDVFDDPCDNVIAYIQDQFPLAPLLVVETFEAGIRETFKEWQNQPQNYMAMATLLPSIAENPFITPSLCEDCYECVDYPQEPDFDPFNDPRVTVVPAPIELADRYAWEAPWDKVTLIFDDVYCMRRFNATIIRGPTESHPQTLIFTIDGQEFPESSGGFGYGNINVTFGNKLGSVIEITPGDASDNNRDLRFAKEAIYMRLAAPPD